MTETAEMRLLLDFDNAVLAEDEEYLEDVRAMNLLINYERNDTM
jgi:hypothetical protein